jgi:hypothetical protein
MMMAQIRSKSQQINRRKAMTNLKNHVTMTKELEAGEIRELNTTEMEQVSGGVYKYLCMQFEIPDPNSSTGESTVTSCIRINIGPLA